MKWICFFALAVLSLWAPPLIAQNSKQPKLQFTIQHADSLFNVSAWKNAIPIYEGVLKTIPENNLAWNKLGFCYHNLGEYDKALNCYIKSLEYNPAPPLEAIVQSRMARTYALKNQKEKAFASL